MSNKNIKQDRLSIPQATSPPIAEETRPVTWISTAEAASLLNLSLTKVLNRAKSGGYPEMEKRIRALYTERKTASCK